MLDSSFIIALCLAYLLGSVNSAILICKMMHLPSPIETGSNNPGATNVLRIGGKKAAIYTLLGDALKGLLPVLFAQFLELPHDEMACVAIGAVLGHIFPIFFDFKGGKGVATMLGAAFGFNFTLGFLVVLSWLITAKLSTYASLASLVSAVALVILSLFFLSFSAFIPLCILAALIFWRHRENIERLKAGTEKSIKL